MNRQTAIALPEQIYLRLQALSKSTGKPADFYIVRAIEEHLSDIEDVKNAEQVLARIQVGQEFTWSLDAVEAELGLAD